MSDEGDDPIKDAHEHVKQAIAELKAANVNVPLALHRAAHALSYVEKIKPRLVPITLPGKPFDWRAD